MADNELFKTTLVGGYDKDDVEKHIQKMKDEAYVNKNRLLQILKQREQTIQELTAKLDEKETQLRQKDRDIKEKYQTYIDNYEQIGRLVYESRVRADRMIIDAREESRRIIQEARNLAKQRLDRVQVQIDDKLDEGRMKHQAIQKELEDLMELLKEVRKRCMLSYDNVEKLVNSYTDREDPFADIMSELEAATGTQRKDEAGEVSVQDQIFFMKNQYESEVQSEEDTFDEEDSPEELERISKIRHEMDDDEEDDPDYSKIHVLSVEEVLKSIDEQQAAVAAAKARKSGETVSEEVEEMNLSEDQASVDEENTEDVYEIVKGDTDEEEAEALYEVIEKNLAVESEETDKSVSESPEEI